MPAARNRDSGTAIPISSVLAQATSATTTALTIPAGCRIIVVTGATVKHYLRLSGDNSEDCATSNSAILQIDGTETLYPKTDSATRYLLVEAVSSTGTVDVSYWS